MKIPKSLFFGEEAFLPLHPGVGRVIQIQKKKKMASRRNKGSRSIIGAVLSVGLWCFVVGCIPVTSFSLSTSKSKRPLVSLTGPGDISGFLYGKVQRATSFYGSGLVGPATAIVHGAGDVQKLLAQNVVPDTDKDQLRDLDSMLWNQFGMASCEGSIDREDLLAGKSYLKPRLAELRHTLLFLDATRTGMRKTKKNHGGEGGLGQLLSAVIFQKEPELSQQQSHKSQTDECWLDMDLIRSAVNKGSRTYIVCESHDTNYCARAVNQCLLSMNRRSDDMEESIVTIISPDDGVTLGSDQDSQWKSVRPQDLEGELTQPISVRDGSQELSQILNRENDDIDNTMEDNYGSQARIAAASATYTATNGLVLTHQDLAEVCLQCALRLPDTGAFAATVNRCQLRVIRVLPLQEKNELFATGDSNLTERPNLDYFSMMGGPKAKVKAGMVTSVDWVRTLSVLMMTSNSDCDHYNTGIKEFPKRSGA